MEHEGGRPTALAIVYCKTSTREVPDHERHVLQLQVYAGAGWREGLDVHGAYGHDLKATRRDLIPVDVNHLTAAERIVVTAAELIQARDYRPNPVRRCRTSELRAVCRSADTGG